MNFINALTKHKIVEINKSHGLLSGHIVAQAAYRQIAAETYLDNGAILFLDQKAELTTANGTNPILKQPFLHYTEELMNGPVLGTTYFTVDLDEVIGATPVCYPRAIALYEGDEYTTSNFKTAIGGGLVAGTIYFGIVDPADGIVNIVAAYPLPAAYTGPVFVATKDTLAAGDAAVHLTLVEKYMVADAVV